MLPKAQLKWLYIDFNSYFASVEQQLHPEFRGKPLIVIPVESEYTSAIAASHEAKKYGIKTGTNVGLAKQVCPELICVIARHDHYVEYHHRLLEEINNHIPVEQVCSIDECACKLMDNESSPEVVFDIAQRIKEGIARNVGEYLTCSIGVSTNRYLAKIASNIKKPNGFEILYHEDITSRLADKPLDWLTGVGYGIAFRLRSHGIGTIPELYNLDPRFARRIWGSVQGERYMHLLHGEDLPDIETKRSTVGHSHVLGLDFRPVGKAKIVASRLTCKAASRLRRIGYYATKFYFSIRTSEGQRIGYERSFYRSNDNFTLLELLHEVWAQMLREHKIWKIKKISVTFFGLIEMHNAQEDMFEILDTKRHLMRQKHESLSAAMDKLNAKFGRDSVVIGDAPQKMQKFSGTKIAFSRIPDIEEFWE